MPVRHQELENIYDLVKTPYKQGIVFALKDKMVDSPSIFFVNDQIYITYIVYDGTGYETWLAVAKNNDLLNWVPVKKILSYTENTWDATQKAGYMALQNYEWGGDYELQKYQNKYWLSYLGGCESGYEAGVLQIGVASSFHIEGPWERLPKPVLSANHRDRVIYKSTIIRSIDGEFLMFYNARGTDGTERIFMAKSQDMINWQRYLDKPIIDNHSGISGDLQITKIGDLWVGFYFGAFWGKYPGGAFDTFAVSKNLSDWTLWDGPNLIEPSETYDLVFAHKPCVLKIGDVVYHFYNAVDNNGKRTIALATSKKRV